MPDYQAPNNSSFKFKYKVLGLLASFAACAAFLFAIIRLSPLKDSVCYLLLALLMAIVRETFTLKESLQYYLATAMLALLILGFPQAYFYVVVVASWPLLKYALERQKTEQFTAAVAAEQSAKQAVFSPRSTFIIKTFLKPQLLKALIFFSYIMLSLLLYRFFFFAAWQQFTSTKLSFLQRLPLAELWLAVTLLLPAFAADYILSCCLQYYRQHWQSYLQERLAG